MIFLLNTVVKVSAIFLLTLVSVRLLRRRSAALRHCVLAVGILSAAIAPGLGLLLPEWTVHVMVNEPVPTPPIVSEPQGVPRGPFFTPVSISTASAAQSESIPQESAAAVPVTRSPVSDFSASLPVLGIAGETLLLWAIGSLLMLGALMLGLMRLMWITGRSPHLKSEAWKSQADEIARFYGLGRPPTLLQSRDLSALFTWGWRKVRILVPPDSESWPEDRIRAVLCHELAHARRGDWIVQMTAELVRVVHWFNPLIWLACRRLRRESEQACDDTALTFGISDSEYAGHLLDVVRSLRRPPRKWSCALSMAGSTNLEQRFAAMLNPSVNRRALTARSVAVTFLGFLAVTIPLSIVRGASIPAESAPALPPAAIPQLPATFFVQVQEAAGVPGSVEGTVRRMGTGEPVPGVRIALQGGPADPKAVEELVRGAANRGVIFRPKRIGTVDEVLQDVLDAAGAIGVGPGFPLFQEALDNFTTASSARYTTLTGRDGRFSILSVPPGQYRVRSERDGFFDPATSNPLKVTVESNRPTETTISLSAGGVLSGRILDALGRPIQDASVDALALTYENGFPVLRAAVTKTTDDEGEYRLFWLVPGDYYIQATIPARAGVPSPYLRTLYPGNPDVSGAAPVTVRAGDVLSGHDIKMRSDRLPKLSGRLTTTIPAEETAQQAQVLNATLGRPSLLLVGRDPTKPDITGGGARVAGTVVLNGGTGEFQTVGVLPGSYDLYARIPESNANGGAGFAFARVPVEVGDQDISGLSLAVNHSVNVKGTVTVDGKAPQRTAIRLALRSDGSAIKLGIFQTLSQRYVNANPDGSFTVIQVPPAVYRVDLGPGLPENLYLADVRFGARSVLDSGFSIGSETPDPVQVLINSGAGTVEGSVQDGSGKTLSGVTVLLAPPETRRQNTVLYHTATTDASGRFVIHNVAPGGYKLFSWQQNVPAYAWYNASFMSRYEERGRTIIVTQGSTVTQQVIAIP